MALNRVVATISGLRASDEIRPRSVTDDILSIFTVHVVSFLTTLAIASVTARWLGPQGKGTLSLILLGSGLLALLLSGGVNVANAYFAASGRLPVSRLTGLSVSWTMLATAAACAMVGGAAIWRDRLIPGVPQWALWAVLGLVPPIVLGGNLSGILQGLQRISAVSTTRLAQSTLTLVLTLALVAGMQWGLFGALVGMLAAQVIGIGLMSNVLVRHGGILRPRWPGQAREVISFGVRGHIANLLQFLNYRLDMFIVNVFLGPAAVGIYGVAVSLAEFLWFLPDAAGFAIFPRTASGQADARSLGWRFALVTMAMTAAGAVLLAAFAPVIIATIFSPAFSPAYPALVAVLPGAVLMSGAKVLANEIVGRGYPQYNAITAAFALVITVVLDLLLIPRFGITGAAVATSLAYATILICVVYFSWRIRRSL